MEINITNFIVLFLYIESMMECSYVLIITLISNKLVQMLYGSLLQGPLLQNTCILSIENLLLNIASGI